MYQAFGTEAKRQALIDDIAQKGELYQRWLTRASVEGDIGFVSDDYGLHPALARLLPALGAFGEGEDSSGFYEALLRAIPLGADTGRLARQSVLQAWNDPVYGRANIVHQGPVCDACRAIADLVARSMEQPVDKKGWRAARAKLVAVCGGEDAATEAALDLMMSLAWDLDQAPGAAHDVISAWASAIYKEADAADEDRFSPEEEAAFETAMNAINEEAMEALAKTQPLDQIDVDEFLAEAERLWSADPVRRALKERSIARRERTKAKMAQWRAHVQQHILALSAPALERQGG